MNEVAIVLMVPTLVFLLFVAPVWLVLHYRSKRQQGVALSEVERRELEVLAEAAQRMTERIATLERILDVEAPEWRNKVRSR